MNIDLESALELIAAAKAKAWEIGVPMVISVVDAGGNLVAVQRMDQALLVSVDISINKAYTAVALKMSTEDLARLSQPGQPLFGIHLADGGRIVIFGGGIPLKRKDEIIGGIGVSGGSVEEDVLCADAAVARFKEMDQKKPVRIEIIRGPSPHWLEMLLNNVRPQERLRLADRKWGAVGLVQARLIDLYWAADVAEKAGKVVTALVMGNCPQHIQMLAIFGPQSEVDTALAKLDEEKSRSTG